MLPQKLYTDQRPGSTSGFLRGRHELHSRLQESFIVRTNSKKTAYSFIKNQLALLSTLRPAASRMGQAELEPREPSKYRTALDSTPRLW